MTGFKSGQKSKQSKAGFGEIRSKLQHEQTANFLGFHKKKTGTIILQIKKHFLQRATDLSILKEAFGGENMETISKAWIIILSFKIN